jgi:peptidoglycan/LPS O-acetylase OafA/YrhL
MSRPSCIYARKEKQKREIASDVKSQSRQPLDLRRRIPELDGLRGVAILLLIFFHYFRQAIVAHPPELLWYVAASTRVLWSGVDLFFIISGFLISGILLDTRNSPNYFSTFYIRRFCRIFPIYFVFIGLVWIAYRFLYQPIGAPLDWVFAGRLPWYAYLTFETNLWMAKWNTLGPIVLAITWSLAIEEQFYLLLPAIIRFVRRPVIPYVCFAGIALAPVVRLFIALRFRNHLWATYALLPCRMDSLFLGVLCAYYLREPNALNWLFKRRTMLWLMLFALLAGMPALDNVGVPFTLLFVTVGYGWMSLFYATALILALTDTQSYLSRTLRRRWLASLGEIGYSFYLFHLGVYCLCLWLFTGHERLLASWKDLGVAIIALVITTTFCKLSWRYFEKPIVRWSHSWKYAEPAGKEAVARDVSVPRAELAGVPIILETG